MFSLIFHVLFPRIKKKKHSVSQMTKKDSADDSDQIFIFQSHLMTHGRRRKIFSLTVNLLKYI